MTPRDRLQRLLFEHRTDPIYNRCMICGQSGHCSASCPKAKGVSMEDKEAIYDEKIAPLMTQLLEICQREGVPMFASFQYSDDGFCTSALSTGHCVLDHYRVLAQCAEPGGVNVDKYMNWVAKDAWKNGHSSMYLKMAGIPLAPDTAHTKEQA